MTLIILIKDKRHMRHGQYLLRGSCSIPNVFAKESPYVGLFLNLKKCNMNICAANAQWKYSKGNKLHRVDPEHFACDSQGVMIVMFFVYEESTQPNIFSAMESSYMYGQGIFGKAWYSLSSDLCYSWGLRKTCTAQRSLPPAMFDPFQGRESVFELNPCRRMTTEKWAFYKKGLIFQFSCKFNSSTSSLSAKTRVARSDSFLSFDSCVSCILLFYQVLGVSQVIFPVLHLSLLGVLIHQQISKFDSHGTWKEAMPETGHLTPLSFHLLTCAFHRWANCSTCFFQISWQTCRKTGRIRMACNQQCLQVNNSRIIIITAQPFIPHFVQNPHGPKGPSCQDTHFGICYIANDVWGDLQFVYQMVPELFSSVPISPSGSHQLPQRYHVGRLTFRDHFFQ